MRCNISCLRCGKCCHYRNEHGILKACRYLMRIGNGLTACSVYETRLGRTIAIVNFEVKSCVMRDQAGQNYPGCPYNRKEEHGDHGENGTYP